MSKRTEQIASVLRRAVQQVIDRGLNDPRLDAMITVTRVKVTEDLLTAVVNVTVTPAQRESRVIHGLDAASRHIRRRAGDMIDMRRLPELTFKIDKSQKKQNEVLGILADLARESDDRDQGPDTDTDQQSHELSEE